MSAPTPRYALAQRLRERMHYAWVVAAVCFVTLLAVAAVRSMPGVLMVPLSEQEGWSRGTISLAVSIGLALFGLMGPFAAALMQRVGMRRTMLAALLLLGLAMASSTLARSPLQLIVTWGLLGGIGTGMLAMVLGVTVVNRWFEARRGSVLGALTASTATGQLLFLPLLAALSSSLGWRTAMLVVAGVALSLIPLVWWLLPERPAEVGLRRYGAQDDDPPPAVITGSTLMMPFRTLAQAARVPAFWLLFGSFFVCGLSTNGLVGTHLIAFCIDNGIPEVRAAGLLAAMGVFDILGTTLSGWLSDRYDNRHLLFIYYGLRGLSLLFLPYSGFSFYGLGLFTLFYGLDWIATVPPTVRLTSDVFGRERAPMVYGWIGAGHQLGAATAAFGAGVLREVNNRYLEAFEVAGFACILTACMVLMVRRPGTGETRELAAAPA